MHARLLSLVTLPALVVVIIAACGPALTPDLDGGVTLDAGTDAGTDAGETGEASCNDKLPVGPPCCNASGDRLTDADCGSDGWTCDEGALCECADEPASFFCTDACGSDAFRDPECVDGAWTCGGNLERSDACPEDICWGNPGDCCVNPTCGDDGWECESLSC